MPQAQRFLPTKQVDVPTMDEQPQAAQLPPFLQYRPTPQLVQIHQQISLLMQTAKRKIDTSNNVHAKQAMSDYVLPLFDMMAGWIISVQEDLVNRGDALFAYQQESGGDEVIAGIPSDVVEDLVANLQGVDDVLASVATGVGAVVLDAKEVLELVHRQARAAVQARSTLAEVIAAIHELELPEDEDEEDEEDDEDDEDLDDEEEDDEDAPLLAAAAEADEPLIEAR